MSDEKTVQWKAGEDDRLKGNQVRILDNTRCCMGVAEIQ